MNLQHNHADTYLTGHAFSNSLLTGGSIMKKHLRLLLLAGTGMITGFLNGLFGAGGGMAAVLLLKKCNLHTDHAAAGTNPDKNSAAQTAHATSIALIFALSLFSAIMHLSNGNVALNDVAFYIPGGILGAVMGAALLKKISPKWLKRIFSVFMLYTAYRLIFG